MPGVEVVVAAIILNPNGEVLLCKSHKWRNRYVIPGGHVEFGETLEQALIREVKEETGLHIYDLVLVGLKENVFQDLNNKIKHYIVFDFECKTNEVSVVLNDEAESYLWIREEEMFSLELDDYTRSFFMARTKGAKGQGRTILYNV